MEGLRLVVLLFVCTVRTVSGESIVSILGDPVEFSATENCKQIGARLVHRLKDDSARLVTHRDAAAWKPAQGYEDKMSPNESVTFNSSNMNDEGLYELTCDSEDETRIHLYVVKAFEVSPILGDNVKFPFHYVTAGEDGKYRLERNGELVFELDLSSEKNMGLSGKGSEGRVSVSPEWKSQGDLSVTLKGVKQEDEGDYFIYILDKDWKKTRGKPAAVRMRFNKRKPDQTTSKPPPGSVTTPPKNPEINWTVCITVPVVCLTACILSCAGICWWLKCRKSNGPGGERPAAPVKMGLLKGRHAAG